MALILGVQAGSRIYIGDTPLDVVSTQGYQSIRVQIDGKGYDITQEESVEVYPQVRMSAGVPVHKRNTPLPRLVIEAPREIVILRSELYERSKGQVFSPQ